MKLDLPLTRPPGPIPGTRSWLAAQLDASLLNIDGETQSIAVHLRKTRSVITLAALDQNGTVQPMSILRPHVNHLRVTLTPDAQALWHTLEHEATRLLAEAVGQDDAGDYVLSAVRR
jgi:hypothetical protein